MTGGKDSSDYLGMFQVGATAGLKPGAPSKKAKGLDHTLETKRLGEARMGPLEETRFHSKCEGFHFIPALRAVVQCVTG